MGVYQHWSPSMPLLTSMGRWVRRPKKSNAQKKAAAAAAGKAPKKTKVTHPPPSPPAAHTISTLFVLRLRGRIKLL